MEETVVVVEGLNDLAGELHPVSQQQEVVDRSLGAADVLQEVQLVRWGKRAKQQGGHQQAEAYLQGKPREGAVVVVAYRRKVAADNGVAGSVTRDEATRHQQCVGARPPVANLLFGLNRQEVPALVAFG